MRPRRLLAVAVLLLGTPAGAQIQMPRSVLGSGAGGGTGANGSVDGTLGQPAIGRFAGPAWLHEAGFWAGPPFPTPAGEAPLVFGLDQNFPNPFNPVTTIRYTLPVAGHTDLRLYDVGGRELARLVDADEAAGGHAVTLHADGLASGVYFYRILAGRHRETRKLILLR